MTKTTVLGALVFLLILGTFVLPVENAEAVTGTAANEQIEQATLTILKQSLDILQAQLNVIAQRLRSPNRAPEEIQALAITLESVRLSLVTLNGSLATRALAVSSPVAAPASPAMETEQRTTVAVVAPEMNAKTEETAVAATTIGEGSGWKKTGRVIWIVVVAALVAWVAYNEIWKKRMAAKSAAQPSAKTT